MKIEEIIEEASEAIGSKRVFSEPYVKNGVTVIPAARVMGGVGGGDAFTGARGQGTEEESAERSLGSGAGYGMRASPAGAFVIKGDKVTWMPAVDVNRLMFGMQIVAIIGLLVARSVLKARFKALGA